MEKKYHLLYVDDEEDNLFSFHSTYRRFYNIKLAGSAKDALNQLEHYAFDMVLSDQRMPLMTGVELFEKIKEQYPDIIRIVITGYSEMQTIIDAINKGKIYHYISKPWNVAELKIVMDNALEASRLRKENKALIGERNRLVLEKTQQEKENILSQFEILKNQINPHFLFNSMNILSSLIPQNQEKAVAFVNNFSHVYRKLLELREYPVVSFEQELEFTNAYIFLQKMRFDDSLKIEMDLGETTSKYLIPPFTLQLLIENAIKHNIVSANLPLVISLRKEAEFIKITNNIQPRGNKPLSTQIGLANLKARYKMVNDIAPEFIKIADRFEVKIPLISNQ